MSVVPVPMADLLGWVPLGNMSPPGHLFPTDHQYLYVNEPSNPASVRQVQVLAPGNITITRARRTHYSSSNTYDYGFEFALCNEVRGEFGHVTTLAADVLAELGAFDQYCTTYDLGLGTGVNFTTCSTKTVAVARPAGASLGTTGGQGTSFALDFTLRDTRKAPLAFANPARWQTNGSQLVYTVAASDYFAEPASSAIRAKLGNFNGSALRTAEPRGGTIGYDVQGTVRGVWINPSKSTFPEGAHFAVVPDVIDPGLISIAVGQSQPEVFAGLYQFRPQADGFTNRDPAAVTADGQVYCFQLPPSQGVLLMQLMNASSLRVEGRQGTTTCEAERPWTFSTKAFDYVR